MSRILARSRSITLSLVCLFGAMAARAQEQRLLPSTESPILVKSAATGTRGNCRILFLGFVGALEPANNKYSGVVQIRQTLQGREYSDVCANSFSPYTWLEGRDWLMKYFPSHPGPLTTDELQRAPKVILMGHSMGGWAMVSVARELRARAIPVELTIQIDSVGVTDYTIPRNVKSAAIFHANDVLMFMTTKHLRCEDPAKTKLLASVTVAGAGHESITRDPRIRELVLDTVASLRITSVEKVPPEPAHASSTALRGEDQE